jgi:hypothetical protein
MNPKDHDPKECPGEPDMCLCGCVKCETGSCDYR